MGVFTYAAVKRSCLLLLLWPVFERVASAPTRDPDLQLIEADLRVISGALSSLTKEEKQSVGLYYEPTDKEKDNGPSDEDLDYSGLSKMPERINICGGAPRPWRPFRPRATGVTAGRSRQHRRLLEERIYTRTAMSSGNQTGAGSSQHRSLQQFEMKKELEAKSTPLRQAYCKSKVPIQPRSDLTPDQRALVKCIRGQHNGCPSALESAAWRAANTLPAMKLAEIRPRCFYVYGSTGLCASYQGNPETIIKGRYPTGIRPHADWKWQQWQSCAVVGRSPVIKIAENGPSIDSHDAVWRFNLQSTKGYSSYIGKKTDMRIVNNADSARAAEGMKGKSETTMFSVGSEEWAFWQYNGISNMERLHRRMKAKVRLLHPAFIRWQMNLYFGLKRELELMGLGPYPCPTSVSSGMHAVFMAMALCQAPVSLYGYSYHDEMLTTRSGHNNGPQALFTGHSWNLDLAIIRLLTFSGRLDVCTGDEPSIPLSELVKITGKDY